MPELQSEAQAKTAMISVRVTPEQYELIHDLAAVLGSSASSLVHEHGVAKAAEMAREAQERFTRRASA